MPTSKASKIRELRADYNEANKLYHRAGKKALGTPKNSPARHEYNHIKRVRNAVGQKLGKLTGRKPRRGG